MTAQLTANLQDGVLSVVGQAPSPDLPSVVLWLGPTLTVEVDISRDTPVRIETDDLTADMDALASVLGTDRAAALAEATDDLSFDFDFVPGPGWAAVRELAEQQWTLEWNPLPHDPALLALDLVRAKYAASDLAHDDLSPVLLDAAYPAARALQRLLDNNGLAAEACPDVEEALHALEASTPLDYLPPELPYTLPVPFSQEEIRSVLDPAPEDPEAILVGSPDWRLTGNGPAANAENTITVRPHASRPGAVTITVRAQPHTDPSTAPAYQAFITDPVTRHTVATATIAYSPSAKAYMGHTLPRRPLTSADLVDIRSTHIGAAPAVAAEERAAARRKRAAIRDQVRRSIAPRGLSRRVQEHSLLAPASPEQRWPADGTRALTPGVDSLIADLELHLAVLAWSSDSISAAASGHRDSASDTAGDGIGFKFSAVVRDEALFEAIVGRYRKRTEAELVVAVEIRGATDQSTTVSIALPANSRRLEDLRAYVTSGRGSVRVDLRPDELGRLSGTASSSWDLEDRDGFRVHLRAPRPDRY